MKKIKTNKSLRSGFRDKHTTIDEPIVIFDVKMSNSDVIRILEALRVVRQCVADQVGHLDYRGLINIPYVFYSIYEQVVAAQKEYKQKELK